MLEKNLTPLYEKFHPQRFWEKILTQTKSPKSSTPYLKLHVNSFLLRLSPGQQRIQELRTLNLSHSKYASYTLVILHKPTARTIQKTFWTNKEGKNRAYRKRSTAN